jgi:hypothetical protein
LPLARFIAVVLFGFYKVVTFDEEASLRADIGKTSCNLTNGMYQGTIIGVYKPVLAKGAWVYIVRGEDGHEQEHPVNNVIAGCSR